VKHPAFALIVGRFIDIRRLAVCFVRVVFDVASCCAVSSAYRGTSLFRRVLVYRKRRRKIGLPPSVGRFDTCVCRAASSSYSQESRTRFCIVCELRKRATRTYIPIDELSDLVARYTAVRKDNVSDNANARRGPDVTVNALCGLASQHSS
jgi:hypothetical protein